MAYPTDGKFNDLKWDVLFKIVGVYQNQAGADPANDPKFNDTVWDLKRKWERARTNAN